VKKLFVCFAVAAASAGIASAQERPAAAPAQKAAAASTHQVGLIDMAHVFKNYEKFKSMTEDMQADAKSAQAEAEAMVEQMKQTQETMQKLTEGSADYIANETKILTLQTKLESFRKVQQREFLRKEAEIYKTVYMEVQNAVQRYAKYYKYTLVLRFNRQTVDAAENPQEIITSMNRQVVHYREEDDLTDPILDFLNDEYNKSKGGAPTTRPASRQATGPAPKTN
jgi:Skp family chaperone for outer membrane proteins